MKPHYFAIILSLFIFVESLPAEENTCAAFVSLESAHSNVDTNNYTETRFLDEYNLFFLFRQGLDLLKTLSGLRKNAIWFDMGSGINKALVKGLESNTQIRRGVGLSKVKTEGAWGDKRVPGRMKQINGDTLESLVDQGRLKNHMGRVDLITDVFGPLSYTKNVVKVMQIYLDLLAQNGQAMISLQVGRARGMSRLDAIENYIPYNSLHVSDGVEPYGLISWIKSIPGISVEEVVQDEFKEDGTYHKTVGLRITKHVDKVVVPQTIAIEHYADEEVPPMRVFIPLLPQNN